MLVLLLSGEEIEMKDGRSARSAGNFFARAAISAVIAFGAASAQALSQGNGDLRVMTYNVNEGTDFV
jgi:hypothetical protein